MHTVSIIQSVLPHYRISFFKSLRQRLLEMNISLRLIYGQEYPNTVPRTVHLHEAWAKQILNRYINISGTRLVWQPCLKFIDDSALVIVEQANAPLINHYLLLKRMLNKKPKLAFWGHGRNMHTNNSRSFSERFKTIFGRRVDWWFAYTDLSARYVLSTGYPQDRIQIINNAIDTRGLQRNIAAVTKDQIRNLLSKLGLQPDNKIGLYCGGLYADKRLGFLIDAAKAINERVSDFNLILIGDGPEQRKIEEAAQKYNWLHYVGAIYGEERAVYFKSSHALLMPAVVGLVILDSFAAGIPIFTLDLPTHPPEIEYLRHGENGFKTAPDINSYADAVHRFLFNTDLSEKVSVQCHADAIKFTLENMVERYAAGIDNCLKAAA